ncbi:MAG: hypothetical protein QOD06_1513 [Candidatus Binatota bacterium]|nr:hypothetical protein [Candidatus Binatota bacterium]
MKILHVDPETEFGGGERQVLGLVRHLARRGHENLLAAAPGAEIVRRLPAADARLVPIGIRNGVDVVAALRLRAAVARERPEMVHFHTSRAHAMAPWLAGAVERSVVTRRMDYPLRHGLRSHLLYNLAVDGVAAISHGVRDQLVAGGVIAGRIRVIESGVEPPGELPGPSGRRAARERFGADGQVVIAVVAALVRRKAHDVLLHALAELRERDVSVLCLVCGDGEERGALESLARSLDLGDHVRFLGRRSQVADVLAAADVFVLPSRHEGLGVAILEAMAMALPVVASRVGGIPEAVVHEETGILVPPEDAASLAAALAELSASAELRGRMGTLGRERVLARFTMERMAERYETLYRELRRGEVGPVDRGPAEVE